MKSFTLLIEAALNNPIEEASSKLDRDALAYNNAINKKFRDARNAKNSTTSSKVPSTDKLNKLAQAQANSPRYSSKSKLVNPIEEMAIRAGTEHKAFITRWDNASWESFYGDFEKMKSNSKKYTTKNEARIASIALAQKKVDAKKSKVTVDDAMTGEKIWSAGDMKVSPGEKAQIDKKPARDPNIVKRSKDAPKEAEAPKKSAAREFKFRLVSPNHDLRYLSPYDHPQYHLIISGFKKEAEAELIHKAVRSQYSNYRAAGITSKDTAKISMPNVYEENYYGTRETRKMDQGDAASLLKRMAVYACDLLKKEFGTDIICTDFDKIESTEKTSDVNKKLAADKSTAAANLQAQKDEKGWTIYHAVGDYEHEGDIGRDYREILNIFREAGIDENAITWDREVEHGNGDNGDGSANILIKGKGAAFKKKVEAALSDAGM